MYKMLTKKDIIFINQQFSSGKMSNESSLEFTLPQTYRSPHWFKTMSLLVRSIIIDQVFEDGNKRTAAAIIMTYLDTHQYNPDKIAQLVLQISKKNIKNVTKIGIMINHAIHSLKER